MALLEPVPTISIALVVVAFAVCDANRIPNYSVPPEGDKSLIEIP